MADQKTLAAVKAAAALHSPIVGVSDASSKKTLAELGIPRQAWSAFAGDLHRLLTTANQQPPAREIFTERLQLRDDSTIQRIAEAASKLVARATECDELDPGQDPVQADCQVWLFRSYVCRVFRAIESWADPAAVPADGVSRGTTLGELVPDLDTGQRKRLILVTNQQRVFRPYNVTASDPGSGLVTSETTARQYAQILWDRTPTPCSRILDFPSED